MTKVSVIVPAYNGKAFIADTLASIAGQTRPPDEIIVVDDASTDDTEAHLRAVPVRHTYIRSPVNGGVCQSRNIGITASSGDVIAFSDQDDLWHPEKLERQVAALESEPGIDFLFANFTYSHGGVLDSADKFAQAPPGFWEEITEGRNGDVIKLRHPAIRSLLKFQPVFPSTLMFRRSMLDRTGPFDETMGREQSEDLEFLLRCDRLCRLAALATPLATIRKHGGNYSANLARTAMSQMRIYNLLLAPDSSYAAFRAEIEEELKNCSVAAFNNLFAEGDLDRAREVLRQIRRKHRTSKMFLKAAVLAMPQPLDRAAQWLLAR